MTVTNASKEKNSLPRWQWLLPAGALLLVLLGAGLLLARPLRSGHRQRRENAFDHLIWEAAKRHRVSPFLVKAVIRRESAFNALARGTKAEAGLMQITAGAVKDWEQATGQRCRLRGLLFDPRLNIEIGTWYLGRAMLRWQDYRDRDVLALAQYNAGPSKAAAWAPADPRDPVLLSHISFPGTREYINRVREYWRLFEKEHSDREQE